MIMHLVDVHYVHVEITDKRSYIWMMLLACHFKHPVNLNLHRPDCSDTVRGDLAARRCINSRYSALQLTTQPKCAALSLSVNYHLHVNTGKRPSIPRQMQ